MDFYIDLVKAGTAHLPEGAERFTYKVPSEYGVIYIPINRLKQVYQTNDGVNSKKVRELVSKMKAFTPIGPVEIGYNYDIHDGHNRLEACRELGYTHAPCIVVGADLEKVREAKKMYRKVWKGAVSQPIFTSLLLVLDLEKAHILHKEHLVKRAVQVKGKNGKTFTRMQWVDPRTGQPPAKGPSKHEDEHGKGKVAQSEDEKRINWDKFDAEDWEEVSGKHPDEGEHQDDSEYGEHEDDDYEDDDYEPEDDWDDIGKPKPKKEPTRISELDEDEDYEEEDEESKPRPLNSVGNKSNKGKTSHFISQSNTDYFDNVLKKQYSQKYIKECAIKQGITWNRLDEYGNMVPDKIDWMRCAMAVKKFIREGGVFEISTDKKAINENMKAKQKDTLEKYFLQLLSKFNGNKQNFMEWARENGFGWKEVKDPLINWAKFTAHIKNELAKGKMINGVRTQQKKLMEKANAIITPDIRQKVRDLGAYYGKREIMSRAEQYGIQWSKVDNKGKPLPLAMEWMRCATGIQTWIAQGHEFEMNGENPNKGVTSASTKVSDAKLSKYQKFALDFVGRTSKDREKDAQSWALKALMIDNPGLSMVEAGFRYEAFKHGAEQSKLMIHFDPFELLPGKVTAIEQMMSDGHMRNPYQLGGIDKEAQEITEREIYGEGFDEAEVGDRPIYASRDLHNQGLKSSSYGSVALVLKDDVKKRSSVIMGDSCSLPWETNGKYTRHGESPHQAIVDKWTSRWKNPNKPDKVRQRAMDALIKGETNHDEGFYESQILGGVDFKRDVDHILVPKDWSTSTEHFDKHQKLQEFSKLIGVGLKYE